MGYLNEICIYDDRDKSVELVTRTHFGFACCSMRVRDPESNQIYFIATEGSDDSARQHLLRFDPLPNIVSTLQRDLQNLE